VQRCKSKVLAVSGWRLGMHLTQGRHFRVPGLSPQVSGTGYQVQLLVRGKIKILNLYPNLKI
jgi:hypothetical protein